MKFNRNKINTVVEVRRSGSRPDKISDYSNVGKSLNISQHWYHHQPMAELERMSLHF